MLSDVLLSLSTDIIFKTLHHTSSFIYMLKLKYLLSKYYFKCYVIFKCCVIYF